MTLEQYHEAEKDNLGWCTECEDLTRPCTEPDAEGYDCPECGQNTVVGCLTALMDGLMEG